MLSNTFHPSRFTPSRVLRFAAAACFTLALSAPGLSAQVPDHKRTLSGTVTCRDHERLRGAVVELQEGGSEQVESYITAQDGHYHFNRLDSEADYKVWVIFRKRHSKSREISKFDSHTAKVIDFTIETF